MQEPAVIFGTVLVLFYTYTKAKHNFICYYSLTSSTAAPAIKINVKQVTPVASIFSLMLLVALI